MSWNKLSAEERLNLLSRRRGGEDVGVLAAEVGMPPTTLERRLREVAQYVPEKQPRTRYRGKENEYPQVGLRAAVFDIETTNFYTGGPNGHLICGCFLPLDTGEVSLYHIEYSEDRDDRRLLADIVDAMSAFDILIGHNITAFDMNWLYSRLVYFGMAKPRRQLMYDTYQAARRIALKDYKSLGNLGAYFNVKGAEKTAIFRPEWHMIDSPYQEDFERTLGEIAYHCEQDVILNRAVFDALWAYDTNPKFVSTKW